MRTIAAALLASLAFAAGPAAAQTEPETVELEWLHDVRLSQGAALGEPVFIEGITVDCEAAPLQLRPRSVTERSGGIVVVEIEVDTRPLCTGHNRRLPQAFEIGPLERVGTYSVIVVGYDPARPGQRFVLPQSVRGELSVQIREQAQLHAYHSGLWNVQGRPGEGLLVEALPQGSVFAYFGNDTEGRAMWLLSEVIPHSSARGKLFAYPGGTFDAPSGTAVEWGEISFSAFDELQCRALNVELSRNGAVVKRLELTKLTAARSQPGCR